MKAAQAELEKAFAGTETEKALRLNLENQLSEMKKMHEGDVDVVRVLEEKDRSGFCPWEALTVVHLPAWGRNCSLFSSPHPFLLFPHSEKTRVKTRMKGKGTG